MKNMVYCYGAVFVGELHDEFKHPNIADLFLKMLAP